MKRFYTILLSLIMAFSLCLTACGKKDENANGLVSAGNGKEDQRVDFTGVHDYTAPEIPDKWLIKDGRTEYVLVVSDELSGTEYTAKEEFIQFFKEATGITIRTVQDKGLKHTPTAKYISLGENDLFASSGLTYNQAALTPDGVRIITKDNSVYLLGGMRDGIIYAVYDFLQICFNYEYYYRNCYVIDRNVTDLPLKDFNVTDVPDVENRVVGNQQIQVNTLARAYEAEAGFSNTDMARQLNRFRTVWSNTTMLPVYEKSYPETGRASYIHNSDLYISRNMVTHDGGTADSKWFGNNGLQLCYTAQGDEEAWKAMVKEMSWKVIDTLIRFPRESVEHKDYMTLTVLDGGHECTCDSCNATAQKDGGAYSGAVIRTLNGVMEIVDEWMNQPENIEAHYKRDLTLIFFAYGRHNVAPVVWDETKADYVPANEEVVCRDDVGVFFCMSGNPMADIYDEERENHYKNARGWGILSDTLWIWTYVMNYQSYSAFYDSYSFLTTETYKFLIANGANYMYNQACLGAGELTSFLNFKEWLYSKMMWDCNQDVNALLVEYFDAMYEDASSAMQDIFWTSWRHMLNMVQSSDSTEAPSGGTSKAYMYPYRTYLVPMLEKYEKAYQEIEKYKTLDNAKWHLLRSRIGFEEAAILMKTLELHGQTVQGVPAVYNQATKTSYIERLRAILEYSDLKVKEGNQVTMSSFLNGLN